MSMLKALTISPWLELRRRLTGTIHSAEIDVTDRCNLNCAHCYHFQRRRTHAFEEPSIQEWQRRFADLHRRGIRYLLMVGGEPALRMDVLDLADAVFPFVYVITNGTIAIPRSFRHRLFVSIDGTCSTNDKIRGEGVFDKVMANYHGDSRAVLNMTVNRQNFRELENVVRISNEHGFQGVVCNIFTPTLKTENPMKLTVDERNSIIEEMIRVKRIHPRRLLLSPRMISWYAEADHRKRCYWGDDVLHFDLAWNQRRCFTDADCANCGCLGGAFQSPPKMARHPIEMLTLMY